MTKKTTRVSVKKPATQKIVKKTAVKTAAARTIRKRSTASQSRIQKVDYYPNRMTVAISALAGTILVLVAVIAVLGSRS